MWRESKKPSNAGTPGGSAPRTITRGAHTPLCVPLVASPILPPRRVGESFAAYTCLVSVNLGEVKVKLLSRTKRSRRCGLATLISDVERVWRTSDLSAQNAAVLLEASQLAPAEAADLISLHLRSTQSDQRGLARLGVAVGLTTTDHLSSAVYGTWRSDLPVILVSSTRGWSDEWERAVAVEVGQLVYVDAAPFERDRLSREFAAKFNGADLKVMAESLRSV